MATILDDNLAIFVQKRKKLNNFSLELFIIKIHKNVRKH